MILTLYAIKQISTGFFMPAGKSKGFTHDMPVDPTKIFHRPPRLFTTKRGAANALNWWLKGEVTADFEDGYACGIGEITPQPHRKADDMKVVPVTLIEDGHVL